MSEGIERLHEVFVRCVERDGDDRKRTLDELCGDDQALKIRVQRLLDRHEDAASRDCGFLVLDAADPERIGPYRLLQRMGEGGMGIVYAAEQREPVRRRIALKVLRHGHGSHEVLARFDAERHALALMNHPNIARIFDAGTTADHRPYIVMEFVPGQPLTRYCERTARPLRERLELFCAACDAVQHAHQRGVIHRDLKPSNILVMEEDNRPVVKIIDFGIAKAISQRLTDHTLETRVGSLLGTPDYMSPEQAELSPLDVDTRADVYALGAVLYELLTGAPPLALSGSGKSYAEMLRVIHEQNPAPPSQRADASLRRQVRGELDWIALKALEKHRNDRYASAAELERDIRAHLANRNIVAGPPSPLRGLHKFVRRHWFGTAAAVIVAAALSVLQVELIRKNHALEIERDRASHEAAVARQVTRFTAGLFEYVDPADSGSTNVSAVELLDAGVARLEKEAASQPAEIQAALLAAAGTSYQGLGRHAEAEDLLGRAVGILRSAPLHDPESFARTFESLALLKRERGLLDEAEALEREALAALESSASPAASFRVIVGLSETLRDQGRYDDAASVVEPWLFDRDEASLDAVDFGYALSLLGSIRAKQGHFGAAEALLLDAIARQRQGGGESANNLRISMGRLAALYLDMGQPERAEPMLRESLELARLRYGDVHSEVATSLNNLANAVSEFPGRYAEAETLYRQALEIRHATVGASHPSTLVVKSNLAWLYGAMQDWQRANDLYAEVATGRLQLFGPDHISTANARLGQARALLNLGRADEAVPSLREIVGTYESSFGAANWRTADARRVLGSALLEAGDRGGARRELEEAWRVLSETLGDDHHRTQVAKAELGRAQDSPADSAATAGEAMR